MRPQDFAARLVGILLAASLSAPVNAGPGHADDDDSQAPGTSASPRFEAVSDAFELVGILDGRRLTLYLDRADDNSPVAGATLEVELGGMRLPLTDRGSGVFEAELADAPARGVTPVTAVVVTGEASDLLAGELDIHEDDHAQDDSASQGMGRLASLGGLGAGAVALLAAVGLAARRVFAGRRQGDAR